MSENILIEKLDREVELFDGQELRERLELDQLVSLIRGLAVNNFHAEGFDAVEPYQAYIRGMILECLENGLITVAILDEEPVSMAAYSEFGQTKNGKTVYSFGKFSTLKNYRNRGLNTVVSNKVLMQFCRENDPHVTPLILSTKSSIVKASFSKRPGWKRISNEEDEHIFSDSFAAFLKNARHDFDWVYFLFDPKDHWITELDPTAGAL